MGQSKGGGYKKKDVLLPEQMSLLKQILSQSGGNTEAAAEGYKQFLPGGGGGEAIKQQAYNDYQQRTIPSIMNAFGSNNKGSSALNQALASSGADLNTNLASLLSQYQLNASQGLGQLGIQGQQQGLGTPGFAYLKRQPPLWQQLLQGGIQAGGSVVGGLGSGGFFNG